MSRTLWISALLLALAVGCEHAQPKAEEAPPPEVMVSVPVRDTVVEYAVFTGRTQAANRAELRSRVTGYLDKVYVGRDADVADGKPPIHEGDDVKKGDVLFVIQQKPFEDALTQAAKNLEQLRVQRDYNK